MYSTVNLKWVCLVILTISTTFQIGTSLTENWEDKIRYKRNSAEKCQDAMGLQSGELSDDQITASTYHSVGLNPHRCRLFGSSSWSALILDQAQYLEFNFKDSRVITGISTQGRGDAAQWVKTYTVAYRTKTSGWIMITTPEGVNQVFNGNSDQTTVVTNYFPKPVTCVKLRIMPMSWTGWMSLRMEIQGCFKPYGAINCDQPMGLRNGELLDNQITASTYHSTGLSPHKGRLGSLSSWSALVLEPNQFIEINFKGEYDISGVATQGRHDAAQWVTTYMVSCYTKNYTWIPITDELGKPQVFNGNYDTPTVITNYFTTSVQCRRLRIRPLTWTSWMSMRVEVLGCYKPYKWSCDEAMGLENKKILDDQITASTYHSSGLSPQHGRLNSISSWSALTLDQEQYLEFYFKGERVISGISTQGRKDVNQWVSSYTIAYRTNNKSWTTITDTNGVPKVFHANYDSTTIITNYFDEKITCSRIRFLPKQWTNWISMRMEIIGCFQEYAGQCDGAMGMANGRLTDDQITASTYHSPGLNPHRGRLNSDSSWSALTINENQYLEIYFKNPHTISGISTQGRADASQWVSSYIVTYRTNDGNWKTVKDASGKDQMFVGNFDTSTVITNYFNDVITCSRLRIHPKRWTSWVSMRAEIRGCFKTYDAHCDDPMGLASGQVQNNQLTASTYHSVGLNPHKGRVNGTTSWSALTLTRGQYYEVYFKGPRVISGVSTQGRGDATQWVTAYKIAYRTNDDLNWKTVKGISGQDQIFIGNFDITTIITNYFDHPIICSRIRLIPQTWTNWMSMRAEFRGCFQRYGSQCEEPIGIQSNKPTTVTISASSFHSDGLSPRHSQLNGPSSWAAKDLDFSQYLEMSFANPLHITAVSTQGRPVGDQWVTAYKISYLTNDKAWIFIVDASGQPMVFPGNFDANTIITHFFDKPITTTKVRITPTLWNNYMSMRAGFHGCDASQILTTPSVPTLPPTIAPIKTTTEAISTTTTSTPRTIATTTTSTKGPDLLVNSSGCQLTTIDAEHTLGIFYVITENHWCINRKPIFDLMACTGKCLTSCSQGLSNPENCGCAPVNARPRSISLHCTNGQVLPFVYLQPSECGCNACTNPELLDVRIQEFPSSIKTD